MKLKRDTKFGEESTCRFKIGIRNLTNFDLSTRLLNKVYIVWAKKVQRSYLSWHWRVIQNLERNRLVVSKLPWGIWQILTRALETLKSSHFSGLLLNKVYILFELKKVQRRYLSWHWRMMENFRKNWLMVWKMTWGVRQIFTRSLENIKIGTFMGSFCPK